MAGVEISLSPADPARIVHKARYLRMVFGSEITLLTERARPKGRGRVTGVNPCATSVGAIGRARIRRWAPFLAAG